MSPSRPAVISSTVYVSEYAEPTHSTVSRVAFRSVTRSGMAMLTMVMSSRVMNRPRQNTVMTSVGRTGRLP